MLKCVFNILMGTILVRMGNFLTDVGTFFSGVEVSLGILYFSFLTSLRIFLELRISVTESAIYFGSYFSAELKNVLTRLGNLFTKLRPFTDLETPLVDFEVIFSKL